jgi:hypothetical protein
VSLAPTGAPQVNPISRVNEAQPGRLKRGRIIGSKSIPKDFIIPVLFKISDATKKGNNEGNTVLNQRSKPSLADSTAVFGKIISSSINKIHTVGSKKDFKYIIYEVFLIKKNKVTTVITKRNRYINHQNL